MALSREELAHVVESILPRMAKFDQQVASFLASTDPPPYHFKEWNTVWHPRQNLNALLEAILRRRLPLSRDAIVQMADWLNSQACSHTFSYPLVGFIAAVENLVRGGTSLDDELVARLRPILKMLEERQHLTDTHKLIARLQLLIETKPRPPLQKGEVWSNAAMEMLEALPDEKQVAWMELLNLCAQSTGAKPTGKWLAEVRKWIQGPIGSDAFACKMLAWFPLVDKPRPEGMQAVGAPPHPVSPLMICNLHGDVLRGLVWACREVSSPEIHRALTALALSSYRKMPGTGPRLVKVGNACIGTLGAMGGLDAIGQLAILKVRVKFGTAQAMLEKALTAAAQKEGLPREELEEMSVPAYGLTEVGFTSIPLGDATAEVRIEGTRAVRLEWKNAQGKSVKTPPAFLKTNYAEDLKELRQMQKDIERMLSAQVERLDQLYLLQKSWPLAIWRERYLDHPLVGVLTRHLIWNLHQEQTTTPVLYRDGQFETVTGEALVPAETATVTLWHPLHSLAAEIPPWRERIETLQLRQPFKQAHREIYLLTPAEENTGTYSNRFAAHILKQHQFNALCAQRGWKNKLRLMVDDTYPPASRTLPQWNLRAEYWIEGAGSEYGEDTNEIGVYLYLSTDQVRFYAIDAPNRTAHAGGGGYQLNRGEEDHPLPLTEIPPLVFSEIMRDVDLFVGVTSVGNDPRWADGGPQVRYHDYWREYAFGSLSGTATTRKEILERLIPRLKIASQCTFSERFLIVRGTLHEYKIHLGSGNILMSPNDRYLCIVAKASTASGSKEIFLPFEGDHLLSVILSKAFLLAKDTAITDPTILQQIKA